MTTADVLEIIAEQRRPRGGVVRLADGEAGLSSSRTIKRCLSSVTGLDVYLTMCNEPAANSVPRAWPPAGLAGGAWP